MKNYTPSVKHRKHLQLSCTSTTFSLDLEPEPMDTSLFFTPSTRLGRTAAGRVSRDGPRPRRRRRRRRRPRRRRRRRRWRVEGGGGVFEGGGGGAWLWMAAMGPPQPQQNFEFSAPGLSMQSPALNPFDDWPGRLQENRGGVDDFLMEEIRVRSHDILENEEDMQQMLRILSMGGASANLNNVYGFPSYIPSPTPTFNFEDDRTRSSGKAVVGWLKIKAAMRWGIFVRKKAAERRAQLVELED